MVYTKFNGAFNQASRYRTTAGLMLLVVLPGLLATALSVAATAVAPGHDPELFSSEPAMRQVPQPFLNDGVPSYEIHNGYLVTGGDMVIGYLGSTQAPGSRVSTRGIGHTSKFNLWPNGVVYYEIAPDLGDAERERVAAAIEHWNTRSSVTLVERAGELVNTVGNYVYFEPAQGCASWVGMVGGRQALWVGERCSTGSIIHEIGHAAGLFHEHTRSDRDNFITVLWENIDASRTINFDILSNGTQDLGDYDYDSIMHYGETFFSNNGEATILVPDGIVIGQREALSAGDLAAIDSLYGTDLSLNGSSSFAAPHLDTTLEVTNIGESGAQQLRLALPIGASGSLVSYNSEDGWNCVQTDARVECLLAILSEGQSATLNVVVEPVEQLASGIVAELDSYTHDTDMGSNTLVLLEAIVTELDGNSSDSEDQGESVIGSDSETETASTDNSSAPDETSPDATEPTDTAPPATTENSAASAAENTSSSTETPTPAAAESNTVDSSPEPGNTQLPSIVTPVQPVVSVQNPVNQGVPDTSVGNSQSGSSVEPALGAAAEVSSTQTTTSSVSSDGGGGAGFWLIWLAAITGGRGLLSRLLSRLL